MSRETGSWGDEPLSITGEIASGIYGAWRLARGDVGGIGYFNATLQGFWRSFLAMAIVAPLFASVLLLIYEDAADQYAPLRFFSIHAIGYVAAWFLLPLIMFYVVQAIDRERRFFAFVAAYNWSSVLQNFIYIPVVVVAQIGVIPADLTYFLIFVIKTLVFVYTWFIARSALGIASPLAAAIAAGDLILAGVMNWIIEAMLR
ncbi:MAG: putative Permease of the major facilitator superfamily [Rhodospirillales bacterium]|jgi:hypothetical protein|nr:putative Permease of the major facilitator superfamily [Rhodospirillales bacterium]